MNKKVFVGISMIDENGQVTKAMGLMHDLESGILKPLNTEDMSNESIRALFGNYGKYLHEFFGLKQVVEIRRSYIESKIK